MLRLCNRTKRLLSFMLVITIVVISACFNTKTAVGAVITRTGDVGSTIFFNVTLNKGVKYNINYDSSGVTLTEKKIVSTEGKKQKYKVTFRLNKAGSYDVKFIKRDTGKEVGTVHIIAIATTVSKTVGETYTISTKSSKKDAYKLTCLQGTDDFESTVTTKLVNGKYEKSYKVKFLKSGVYEIFLKKKNNTVIKQYIFNITEPATTQVVVLTKKTPVIDAPADVTWVFTKKPFKLSYCSTSSCSLQYKSSDKNIVSVTKKGRVTIKGYGKATVTITSPETNNYYSTYKIVNVNIVPKGLSGFKVVSKKKGRIKAKWKKQKIKATVDLQASDNINFTDAKSVKKNTPSLKKGQQEVKKMKSKKTYYIRARVIVKKAGIEYYSDWTKAKKVKVK